MILAVVMVLSLLPTIAIATDLETLIEGQVYISISDDADFISAPDGTAMGFVAVPLEELLYIDLADYNLEDYIYDADGDDIPEITASCDRSRSGMTVPACGLYLNRVLY